MRYRAATIDARLSIKNRGPHGVVVTCECHQRPSAAIPPEWVGTAAATESLQGK
jgi:hypothetical protein